MFIDFEAPLEVIERYIQECILNECNPDGLLNDIKSTKTIFKDLAITETPAVWVYLSEWEPEPIVANRGNSIAKLTYPVEIVIICNRPDLKDSDKEASNIQSRIVESLYKNWKRRLDKNYNITCDGVEVIRGYSDGKLKIANKQQKIAVKGILADFKFTIDWIKCLNYTIDKNNEIENNTDGG